jgi:hypothetical protein
VDILYIITFIVSVHRLVHCFHVPSPINFNIHTYTIYIATFHRPNILILSNNTNMKQHDYSVYYVQLKWQLFSLAPTSDFRMAVPINAKKEMVTLPGCKTNKKQSNESVPRLNITLTTKCLLLKW